MYGKLTQIIPAPFLFNSLKHHAGFIKNFILTKSDSSESLDIVSKELTVIGHSLTDLYYGSLTPEMIGQEIKNYLDSKSVLGITEYKLFLAAESGEYRMTGLSDYSNWVLRLGNDTDRFIHIHPGKYTAQTIRVRALTLKSAILANIFMNRNKLLSADLSLVNHIRTKYLKESPQKHFSYNYGVGKIINILN